MKIRKNIFFVLLVAGIALALQSPMKALQAPSGTVEATKALAAARDGRPQQPEADNSAQNPLQKESVAQNAKEIKAKTARLYELATELKAEVDGSDMTKVFPTTVVKRAQEIEKLAKDIKSRSKG
jgi:hypothetical protein